VRTVALAVAVAVAVSSCATTSGPRAAATSGAGERVRALRPPRAIDPDAPGAAYLSAIAARVQPAWSQFLTDCRTRLPAGNPLNNLALVTVVDLVIEPSGGVSGLDLATSGVAGFDHAAQDAVIDSSPLPAPPLALLSDDGRVHVRWSFARDDRQAGAATAQLVHVALPVGEVVERLVAAGDLAGAARRIAATPDDDPGVEAAIDRLVLGTLREALVGADGAVRRGAIDAIARGHAGALAGDVRALLADTNDTELRLVAIDAAGALGDTAATPQLVRDLAVDLPAHPRLALAEARALVALGRSSDVAAAIRAAVPASGPPPAVAVEALALAPVAELGPRLTDWLAHGDARTRAAACTALGGGQAAWPAIRRGLADPDAMVRATCADAAIAHAAAAPPPAIVARLHELAADRDRGARARGVAAAIALDPEHVVRAAGDAAATVRAAYAVALAGAPASTGLARDDLESLAADADADVRAAAIASLARRDELSNAVAARAVADPSAAVRLAAIPQLDKTQLGRLVRDADPSVATAAAIRLVTVRGRAASARLTVDAIANATPGSAWRVRAAVAWLLAG
jgi:hypothetical protein